MKKKMKLSNCRDKKKKNKNGKIRQKMSSKWTVLVNE